MEGGRSWKADHPSAICFLYSVYRQNVVLIGPSAWIFLTLGSSQLRARKILVLERSQHHVNYLHLKDPCSKNRRTNMAAAAALSRFFLLLGSSSLHVNSPQEVYYSTAFCVCFILLQQKNVQTVIVQCNMLAYFARSLALILE